MTAQQNQKTTNSRLPSTSKTSALDWTFIGKIWHHWELYNEGRLVASLHSKRFFTLSFEGSFNGTEIIIKKELSARVTISDKKEGKAIAIIDAADFLPTNLSFNNGREFTIINPIFGSIQIHTTMENVDRCLCVTEFDNRGLQVHASFTIVDARPVDPSPWFFAVISLYTAIANFYSNP